MSHSTETVPTLSKHSWCPWENIRW